MRLAKAHKSVNEDRQKGMRMFSFKIESNLTCHKKFQNSVMPNAT